MSAPPGVPLRRKPTAPARNADWMDRIVCRGSSIDFLSETAWEIAAAKRLCRECPVKTECLEYARARRLSGVFGGLSVAVGRPVTL